MSIANRKIYDSKIKPYKEKIAQVSNNVDKLKVELFTVSDHKWEERISLTLQINDLLLTDACNQILISLISKDVMGTKSDTNLEQARKHCSAIIQNWEGIVGRHIDTSPAEQSEVMQHINKKISNIQRFHQFQMVGFTINRLERLYGDSSKWKWTFVDLEGRLIAALKNSMDLRGLIKNVDPTSVHYHSHRSILELIRQRLDDMAERYRNKYELTRKTTDDMKKALQFVAFHRRLCNLISDSEKAEILKKNTSKMVGKIRGRSRKKRQRIKRQRIISLFLTFLSRFSTKTFSGWGRHLFYHKQTSQGVLPQCVIADCI